jgi:hypothetical protein
VVAALLVGAGTADAEPRKKRREVLLEETRDQRIEGLEQRLDSALRQIDYLQAELDAMKRAGVSGATHALATGDQTLGPLQRVQATQPSQPSVPPERAVREEEERVSPDEEATDIQAAALRRARAVLIGEGRLEFEPGLAFTHTDRNRLDVRGLDIVENVFIGQIEVRSVERDSLSPFVGVRYGVSERVQLDMTAPYVFSYDRTFLPPTVQRSDDLGEDVERTRSSYDLGDVTLGLSVHALREDGWLPDLILSSELKTTTGSSPFEVDIDESATGTGFWGASVGATMVKVSDPASVFVNASYFYHMKDNDVGGYDEVDPPDSYTFGAGFSYALNPFLSFTTRFQTRYTEKTRLNGISIDGTDQVTASLSFGAAYALGPNRALDFTVGVGLTDDSPDFLMTLSMPLRWNVGVPGFLRGWGGDWDW